MRVTTGDTGATAAAKAAAVKAAAAKAAAAKAAASKAAAAKAGKGSSKPATGGSGGGGSAPSGGGASSGAAATTTATSTAAGYDASASAQAASYGWSLAVINSDPELKALFAQATSTGPGGGWTTDHFVAKVRDTKWFKTNADTARQAIILQKADPATYNSRVSAATSQARTMAGTVGAALTVDQLNTIGAHSVMFGWNSDQLREAMGSFIKAGTTGAYTGGAATAQHQYEEMAGQYGLTVPPATIGQWVKQTVMGSTSSDEIRNYMVQQASSRYPSLASRLKAGETTMQIADPYMQSYARVLELNPNAISLNDNLVQSAMSGVDKDGKPSTKSVWQFEQDLRQDPRYMQTQGAQDSVMSVGKKVLNDFGMSGA